MFMLLFVLALSFLSEITLFAIFDNGISLVLVIADSLFADFRHLCFNDFVRYAPLPFKVGFRNKHTANRRHSPINKHTYQKLLFLRSDNAKLFDRKQPE